MMPLVYTSTPHSQTHPHAHLSTDTAYEVYTKAMHSTNFNWLDLPADQAAPRLLGCELVSTVGGHDVRVRIVETEAYDQTDESSHTFHGRTARNDAMFKGAGHLYVYFTYGMHHCLNIVCGPDGFGSGALIRAVEPVSGTDIIELRRGMTGVATTNGPGKLCVALAVDRSLSGHYLAEPPVQLIKRPAVSTDSITITPRIGISRNKQALRRFFLTGNPYVSKGSYYRPL